MPLNEHPLIRRIADRKRAPRSWWYPRIEGLSASDEELVDTARTIRTGLFSLVAFALFCSFTLFGTPDSELVTTSARLKVPLTELEVSFLAFLALGPIVLIGLTLYLHLFVGHWIELHQRPVSRRAFLLELRSRSAGLLSHTLLYLLTPLVLLFFAWKALPRASGPVLSLIALAMLALLLMLGIRRCPPLYRRTANVWRWLALGLTSVALASLLAGWRPSRRIDLYGFDLEGKNLSRVYLKGSDLRLVRLNGADLSDAVLEGANLSGGLLEEARLDRAKVSGARLMHASLTAGSFEETDFRDAVLIKADLGRSELIESNFVDADLREARLRGVFVEHSKFDGADLSDADLSGALFFKTDFGTANLTSSRLRGALFLDCNLSRVRGLVARQLGGVTFASSELPAALAPHLGSMRRLEIPNDQDALSLRQLVTDHIPLPLDGRFEKIRTGPTELTRLIAAAIFARARDADFALFNSGSVRLDELIPAFTPIRGWHLYKTLPFENKIVVIDIATEQLEQVLEIGRKNSGTGSYLQTSENLEWNGAFWRIDGALIGHRDRYRVVTNDYLISGLEVGLDFLRPDAEGVTLVREEGDFRTAVFDFLRSRYSPTPETRRRP